MDSFLGSNDTGVLALARDDEPYSIPISYGYDAENRRLFLRLVSTPAGKKRRFLASSPAARLVVYDEQGDVYRSVIATGTLARISRAELTVEHVEQYGEAKRPLFEIPRQSRSDLDIELYRLDPDEVSRRRIVVQRDTDESRI